MKSSHRLSTQLAHSFQDSEKTALIVCRRGRSETATYTDLLNLSLNLKLLLQKAGLSPGDRVLIPANKSIIFYSSILACLGLGINYCVFDTASPDQRLDSIIKSFHPTLILTWADFQLSLSPTHSIPRLVIDTPLAEISSSTPCREVLFDCQPDDLPAYTMFTSGSTGVPKGAVISRANLFALINVISTEFDPQSNLVNTAINPAYFDNSVFDLFSSLPFGVTLYSLDLDEPFAVEELVELLLSNTFSQWFSVPSLLIKICSILKARHITANPSVLTTFVFGGEGYPVDALQNLRDLFPSSTLLNVYGPTECTCIASVHDVTSSQTPTFKGLSPLGTLFKNFRYSIENPDANGQGELILYGPMVCLGYTDSSLSELAFNPSERSYRTGDLVQLRDNLLYHCGRVDNQVKRSGYRIELEEIEAVALSFSSTYECCAVSIPYRNTSLITLFVVLSDDKEKLSLLRHLKQCLPKYMIPDDIVSVSTLPRNRNGKLNRSEVQALL